MSSRMAAIVVFGSSAAVLVIELAAIRLLAPYVGQSLETFTAIVTVVLAGISFGTWVGGRVADRTDDLPRLIGTELLIGGALSIAVVPLVALLGQTVVGTGNAGLVLLSVVALFAPSAFLSAVSPAVVRLSLASLDQTGTTVGRYSAIGTAGAITGSVATGFVLVPLLGTTAIVIGTGTLAVLAGAAVRVRKAVGVVAIIAGLLMFGSLAAWAGTRCDHETRYYCVRILDDPARDSGRRLVLDDLSHSYVDLDDPAHLEFTYTRMLAAVMQAGTDGPIDVTFLGGGAFTLPTWLDVVRPGSTSTVLEVDPDLPPIVNEEMPAPPGIPTELIIGDGRASMRGLESDSADVVIGDAFGGRAVPWHLTTAEFTADIDRVLRPDGLYVANLIDGPDLRFVRAMAVTLRSTWPHVAVLSLPARFATGGNLVVLAGHREVDDASIRAFNADLGLDVDILSGAELDAFVADAQILTDDHAPVDQLLG
ncbi:MAG: fused MFS/spermidine synthase [Acidimicrobiia bacterium]